MPDPVQVVGALKLLRDSADHSTRVALGLALALVTAGGLVAALAPLALKQLVDGVALALQQGQAAPGTEATLLLAGYAGSLGLVRLLAEWRLVIAGRAEQRLLAQLTRQGFERLLAMPMPFHMDRRAGDQVHAVQLAATGCQLLTGHLVNSAVPVLVELAAVCVVLMHLATPGLLGIFMLTATALLTLHASAAFRFTACARRISAASIDATCLQTDTLQHVESVKCFGAELAASTRLGAALDALQGAWRQLYRQRAGVGSLAALLAATAMACSLLHALAAVTAGQLSIGGLVLVNVYLLQILRPLEVLGAAGRDVSQAVGFMQPLLDLLKTPAEVYAMPAAHRPGASAPLAREGEAKTNKLPHAPAAAPAGARRGLRLDAVSFAYPRRGLVLQGLNLALPPGRTLAIVGASGCGKSTLVRLLPRLLTPQAGRITLDGRPLEDFDLASLRARIGLVSQDTALLDGSLAFNIALGRPAASQADIAAAADRAQLSAVLAAMPAGLATRVGHRGLMLSGGERQRVAIARALLHDPEVLVLDEATSMLDADTETAVMRAVMERRPQRSTVVIAHRLGTVRHADEIVVLDQGCVVECGTHDRLLARNGLYARLWRLQHLGAGDR